MGTVLSIIPQDSTLVHHTGRTCGPTAPAKEGRTLPAALVLQWWAAGRGVSASWLWLQPRWEHEEHRTTKDKLFPSPFNFCIHQKHSQNCAAEGWGHAGCSHCCSWGHYLLCQFSTPVRGTDFHCSFLLTKSVLEGPDSQLLLVAFEQASSWPQVWALSLPGIFSISCYHP